MIDWEVPMLWVGPYESFTRTTIREGDLLFLMRTRRFLEVYVTLWREMTAREIRDMVREPILRGRRERLLLGVEKSSGATVRLAAGEPALNSVMSALCGEYPGLCLFDWRPQIRVPGFWLWRTYVAM